MSIDIHKPETYDHSFRFFLCAPEICHDEPPYETLDIESWPNEFVKTLGKFVEYETERRGLKA